jgi:hypothetical protein
VKPQTAQTCRNPYTTGRIPGRTPTVECRFGPGTGHDATMDTCSADRWLATPRARTRPWDARGRRQRSGAVVRHARRLPSLEAARRRPFGRRVWPCRCDCLGCQGSARRDRVGLAAALPATDPVGSGAVEPLVADARERAVRPCPLAGVASALLADAEPRKHLVAILGDRLLPFGVACDGMSHPLTEKLVTPVRNRRSTKRGSAPRTPPRGPRRRSAQRRRSRACCAGATREGIRRWPLGPVAIGRRRVGMKR